MSKDKNKIYNRENFKKAGKRIVLIIVIAIVSYWLAYYISTLITFKEIYEKIAFSIPLFIAFYTFSISFFSSYITTPIFIENQNDEKLTNETDINCYDLTMYNKARGNEQLTDEQYNKIVEKIINRIQ
ncbi:MAG: hypothetical protein RR532_08365 [Erysipelothrix sp.]